MALNRHFVARLFLIGALAALTGCATSKSEAAARGVSVAGPTVGGPAQAQAPQAPQVSTRAMLLFEDANKAFEAQKKSRAFDYPKLEQKYRAALEADPALAEAEYNLGVLAEHQGRKEQAVEHYRSALRKKPTLTEAAENLAVIAQNNGDTPGAINIYQDILQKFPDDGSARARLAEVYRQSGEHERALEMAKEALLHEPKTLAAYKVILAVYIERKELAMAKLVAIRAMKIAENDPELFHAMGLIFLQENEPEKALLQFKKAVEARPDYLSSHVILAKMALDKENYAGAEASLRAVLQADGKNAEAHLNLGVAYKGLGQIDKAMAEYDTAEKLDGNLAAVWLNRGIIVHRVKGSPEKGLELYRKYQSMGGGTGDVQKLIDEAEGQIRQKEEDARAREEAKRMEEEAKRMEAEQKRMEAEAKKEEERLKKEEAAHGEPGAQPGKADGTQKPAEAAPPAEGDKKKDAKKKEPPKPAPPKSAPPPAEKPAKPTAGDPGEPEDNL